MLIIVLSAVNYFGVLFSKIIQNFFTLIKIGTVVVFISIGFSAGQSDRIDLSINPAQFSFG